MSLHTQEVFLMPMPSLFKKNAETAMDASSASAAALVLLRARMVLLCFLQQQK